MADELIVFAQLQKVDVMRRQVWGIATAETPDRSGEIMDYAMSKANFAAWSDAISKATDGKSLGNLRVMHQPIAAGRVIHFEPRDASRDIYIGAEVVDAAEWEKVLKGVYTGFSIGGSYGKRWQDGENKRYEAKPNEISLVDYPCHPGAVFEFVKADGQSEMMKFSGDELGKEFASDEQRRAFFGTHPEAANSGEETPEKIAAAVARIKPVRYGKEQNESVKRIRSTPHGTRIVRNDGTVGTLESRVIDNGTSNGRSTRAYRYVPDNGKPTPWNSVPANFYEPIDPKYSWHTKSYNPTDLIKGENMQKQFPPAKGKDEQSPPAKDGQETAPPAGDANSGAELHEHDALKAKLAEQVKAAVIEQAVADEIWNAIMADEAAEQDAEAGESPAQEQAEAQPAAGDSGTATPAQTAPAPGIDKEAMRSELLALLEELGLVERVENGAAKAVQSGDLQKAISANELQKAEMTNMEKRFDEQVKDLSARLEKLAGSGPVLAIRPGDANQGSDAILDDLRKRQAATKSPMEKQQLGNLIAQLEMQRVQPR